MECYNGKFVGLQTCNLGQIGNLLPV